MRSAAYVAVAVLLLLLQANLYRLFGPIGALLGPRWVHGVTPNLVLPLIVFVGVHEPSASKGALLSFAIGYFEDLIGIAPVGLYTFVSVSVWWLSRIAGVRLTAQTWLTRVTLGFVFSVIQGALLLVLLAVFGSDNRRPLELFSVVLPQGLSTALFAPLVFRLAQRLRQGPAQVRAPAEGAT